MTNFTEQEIKLITGIEEGFAALIPVIDKLRLDITSHDADVRQNAIYMASSFLNNSAHFFKLLHEAMEGKGNEKG